MKRLATLLLIVFMLSSNAMAYTEWVPEEPSVVEVAADLLFLRPLGLIQTILGGVAFGISLPVTLPLRKADQAGEFMIREPLRFTFQRPLGKI